MSANIMTARFSCYADLFSNSDPQGTPFMLMENIQAFLGAARKYGVPDSELFQTADLYERRNIPQVRSGCCLSPLSWRYILTRAFYPVHMLY